MYTADGVGLTHKRIDGEASKVLFDTSVKPNKEYDPEPELIPGEINFRERIAHMKWADRNNQPYPRVTFSHGALNEYIVAHYDSGMLVFRVEKNSQPLLIWQYDQAGIAGRAEINLLDVTGDGQKEILSYWREDGYEQLRIYEKVGEYFRRISSFSPPEKQEFFKQCDDNPDKSYKEQVCPDDIRFFTKENQIKVSDLDGDKIPEIHFPTYWSVDLESFVGEEFYVAYKWTGGVYKLWKKQPKPFVVE